MQVTEGSVRVDLAGGTLDLFPINLQIPEVVTLNMAIGLKANVAIKPTAFEGVIFHSTDYQSEFRFPKQDFSKEKLYFSDHFGKMTFMALILDYCQVNSGVEINLSSGSPAGSGLGGSSAMGVTLYKAIQKYKGEAFDLYQAKDIVQQIESQILRAGVAGYQDYYPALLGGILAIHPQIGRERIEQLYNPDLVSFIHERMTLINSRQSRASGINNWEVYKQFYDQDKKVMTGLELIAQSTQRAYQAIKKQNYEIFLAEIIREAETRAKLFPNILGEKIQGFCQTLSKESFFQGLRVCGAGGGGCFVVFHRRDSDREKIKVLAEKSSMEVLELKVEKAIAE